MKCRFILFLVVSILTAELESLSVSDPVCTLCEPDTLCLAWNCTWLQSSSGGQFRLRLSDLQSLGRLKLARCGAGLGGRVSHALVRMPLSELLPQSARTFRRSQVFYQFVLGPSGKSKYLSGGGGVDDSQGAMVLGDSKPHRPCAHFARRLPPAKTVVNRLCGAADSGDLSVFLVPGDDDRHYRRRRDDDKRLTTASACGFCGGSMYFESTVADLTRPEAHWQLLLPMDRTERLDMDITAIPMHIPSGIVKKCPFRCDNDANCISQDQVCDKRADCKSGADEEAAFCREMRRPQTASEPSSESSTVWWAIGTSLLIVIVLTFLFIQIALLLVRHKRCSSSDSSSDASSQASKDFSSDSGSGGRRFSRDPVSLPRSSRRQRRADWLASVNRRAEAAASGTSQLGRQLLDGPHRNPPSPVVLSRPRLQEMHRQLRLQQLAGAVQPPPRLLRMPVVEDSGGDFDEPMLAAADPINGGAGQRPNVEDSGIGGDGGGYGEGGRAPSVGQLLASLTLAQLRGHSCVPRIPNRRLSPPPMPPAQPSSQDVDSGRTDGKSRRLFGRFF